MGGRRAVGGPGTAVLLCVALIVLTLTSAGPAAAITGNVIAHPTTGSEGCAFGGTTTAISGHPCTDSMDENDATYYQTVQGGTGCSFNGNQCGYQSIEYRWSSSPGGGSQTLQSFRLKGVFPASGCGDQGCTAGSYTVKIECGGTIRWSTTADASALDTGRINFTTPCAHGDGGSQAVIITAGFYLPAGHTVIYSFEAYTTGAVATVPIGDYMVNMRVDHPVFQWTGSWTWRQSWSGSLTLSSSPSGTINVVGAAPFSGTNTYSPFSATAGQTFYPYFWQDCFPLCQSDSVTVTIDDTSRSQTASYTFLRSDSGAVSTPTRFPRFLRYAACFNKTADQCDDQGFDSGHLVSDAVDTTVVGYSWVGSPSTVTIGPRAVADATQVEAGHATQYGGQSEGTYAAHNLGTDVTLTNTWLIRIENAAGERILGYVVLDFGAGGNPYTYTPPDPAEEATCAQADIPVVGGIVCGLREIFAVVASDLRKRISDAVGNCDADGANCTGLVGVAMSRQPFNFIARSLTGVGGQLSRATAAVSSTTTCPGLHVTLPWDVWVPIAYRPTGAPLDFYLLRCADFEPFVSTSWYQAIRTAMDPALILAYGYVWVKRLQPRPVMGG